MPGDAPTIPGGIEVEPRVRALPRLELGCGFALATAIASQEAQRFTCTGDGMSEYELRERRRRRRLLLDIPQ